MSGRLPAPTSPSHRYAIGPSLSPLKGGEGKYHDAYSRGFSHCEIVMLMTRAKKFSSSVPSPG